MLVLAAFITVTKEFYHCAIPVTLDYLLSFEEKIVEN